jgi:hypothetical protein
MGMTVILSDRASETINRVTGRRDRLRTRLVCPASGTTEEL